VPFATPVFDGATEGEIKQMLDIAFPDEDPRTRMLGFNDGKTRHGMEHLSHHHANSVLISWLLTILALTIERLYRLRYLHRGGHRPATAIEFVRALRLSLGPRHTLPPDGRGHRAGAVARPARPRR